MIGVRGSMARYPLHLSVAASANGILGFLDVRCNFRIVLRGSWKEVMVFSTSGYTRARKLIPCVWSWFSTLIFIPNFVHAQFHAVLYSALNRLSSPKARPISCIASQGVSRGLLFLMATNCVKALMSVFPSHVVGEPDLIPGPAS